MRRCQKCVNVLSVDTDQVLTTLNPEEKVQQETPQQRVGRRLPEKRGLGDLGWVQGAPGNPG